MTGTTAPEQPAEDIHGKLGAVAHFLMSAASVVHDGAAFYIGSRNKAMTAELEQARSAAAIIAYRAYHLGRLHQMDGTPLPEDCVAAAARLTPEEADDVVGGVRYAHAIADELGHQGDEPAAAAAVADELREPPL